MGALRPAGLPNTDRQSKAGQPSDLLADWSQRDESWDLRRETADKLSQFFAAVGGEDLKLFKWGARLWGCSGRLLFAWADNDDGTAGLRLRHAEFCRVRSCPICMWRRSLMWLARFFRVLPTIIEAHPKGRWIHLTLTVRNPDISELGSILTAMNDAWNRLRLRKPFRRGVLGWIRSTEVTRGSDGPMQCHPHFHVLLFVSPFYFSGDGYISQIGWRDLWREVARLDYDPSVHVRAVTLKRSAKAAAQYQIPDGVDPSAWSSAVAGALEVLKYATKPVDLVPRGDDDPWLLGFVRALDHRRFVAAGGVLKDVLSKDDREEDLIHGDDEAELGEAAADDGARVAFAVPAVAGVKPRRYRRAPKFDKDS